MLGLWHKLLLRGKEGRDRTSLLNAMEGGR
jgi:hypothetical protein